MSNHVRTVKIHKCALHLIEHVGAVCVEAANVLLTGCSAGGLATYLHVDYIGQTYGTPEVDYIVF